MAHLDVAKEREINDRLRRPGITRVSVAHRTGIISETDRVPRAGLCSELQPAAAEYWALTAGKR